MNIVAASMLRKSRDKQMKDFVWPMWRARKKFVAQMKLKPEGARRSWWILKQEIATEAERQLAAEYLLAHGISSAEIKKKLTEKPDGAELAIESAL